MAVHTKGDVYEFTTYDHKPKYIMREAATIAEWGRCLDDSRSDDKHAHPNWVKSQYGIVDRELGFMRDGFFFKPLFAFDDGAKDYQFIIDYDEPARDKLKKCCFITWDNKLKNQKELTIAGFVSSETRSVYRSVSGVRSKRK